MKNIKEIDLKNKRVLVRSDFNVSVESGKVVDDLRIKEAIPTIKYLSEKGAKVILISHLGRPENQKSFLKKPKLLSSIFDKNKKDSLKPIYFNLKEYFPNIKFISDCVGEKVKTEISKLKEGEIILLENIRYYKEEEEGSEDFAKELSSYGDIYINNAFSVSHRDHSSVTTITKYLPSYPGLLINRELEVLGKVKESAERPFTVIVGGAKIESKAKTIKCFLESADNIILGGKVANTALVIAKKATNEKNPSDDILEKIKDIDFNNEKIKLPIDGIICKDLENGNPESINVENAKKGEFFYDIGPKTIENFVEILKKSKTIIWAGPVGYFEHPKFEAGTAEIAKVVAENKDALKIIGGGDTAYALKRFGYLEQINHISLGGGAMLGFLSDEKLPGIEALNK